MSKIIVIDCGHSMTTSGKRTPKWTDGTKSINTGRDYMHEYEFNKATGLLLKEELERNGFKVVTTLPKDDNIDVSLKERCAISDRANADLFVSIHANALTGTWESKARGIETYTWKSGFSTVAGKTVQEEMIKASGLLDRKVKDGSWLYVIKNQKAPSILVECGFMDNLAESKLLNSVAYREKMAVAIAKGICKAFGVTYKAKPEPKPAQKVAPKQPEPAKPFNSNVHRVIVDGKQVGAYSYEKNVLEAVEKALKSGAKEVKIQKV